MVKSSVAGSAVLARGNAFKPPQPQPRVEALLDVRRSPPLRPLPQPTTDVRYVAARQGCSPEAGAGAFRARQCVRHLRHLLPFTACLTFASSLPSVLRCSTTRRTAHPLEARDAQRKGVKLVSTAPQRRARGFLMRCVLPAKLAFSRARPAGFEPATRGLEERGGVFGEVSWGSKPAYLSLLAFASVHRG